jgi:hypothetical protein
MLFFPRTVWAGQVYGSIEENGRPVREATEIEINCGGRPFKGQTDKYGSYRVHAAEKGKCSFKITHNNQEVTTEVYSYDNPVRYDFELVVDRGRYTLRRK